MTSAFWILLRRWAMAYSPKGQSRSRGDEEKKTYDGSATSGGLVESLLDNLLRLTVEGRSGFVEEKNTRVADEGASDGNSFCQEEGDQRLENTTSEES
jgi:hypothetical protein